MRSCSSRKHILQSLVNSTASPEATYPEPEACASYRSGIRRGPKINSGSQLSSVVEGEQAEGPEALGDR
jgi:hypothetical protein